MPALLLFAAVCGQAACFGGGEPEDGGAVGTGQPEPDAGAQSAPDLTLPGCEDGYPELVEGFALAREVDYIADRYGADVLSERGEPCSGAADRDLCEGALATVTEPFRHLLTTEAGTVRVWQGGASEALFGVIDTPAEAAWAAGASDYFVPCSARISVAFDVYLIEGVEAHWGCRDAQAIITLSVSPEGFVSELRQMPLANATCEPSFGPDGFPQPGSVPLPPPTSP